MRYIVVLLVIIAALVLCGAATLLAVRWFSTTPPVPDLVPTAETVPLPTPTTAAPATPATLSPTSQGISSGPFAGEYAGTLFADNGTSAPLSLTLTQDGSAVSGVMVIGEGLLIDGGSCGQQAVPSGTQEAMGRVDPGNADHLDAGAVFNVSGLSITLDLDADLSADRQSLDTRATIQLPFLCGRTPVVGGSLLRQ